MSDDEIMKQARAKFDVYAWDPRANMQARLAAWQNKNFGYQAPEEIALGVAEEVGELCHALLKALQGIRGFTDREKAKKKAADALADIRVFCTQIATVLRLDYDTLFNLTAQEVMGRNWRTDPVTADAGPACICLAGEPKDPHCRIHRPPVTVE